MTSKEVTAVTYDQYADLLGKSTVERQFDFPGVTIHLCSNTVSGDFIGVHTVEGNAVIRD